MLGSAPLDFSISLTWEWFSTMGAQILMPLMVGSLLCGFAAAAAGYLMINFLWRWKVIRNWEKRKLARQQQQSK